MVTVIVGCFNQQRYVRECLDSLCASGYSHLEVVIVDDASEDSSDEVIRSWLGEHPALEARYIRHQTNVGFARGLNEGIKLSRGVFIAPIAADDVMLPGGLSTRVSYLLRHPAKLAVFADSRVINADGRLLYASGIEGLNGRWGMRRRHLVIDRLVPYCVAFSWAVPGPVFLCRRTAYERVGLYDETRRVEDWDMYLRLCAVGVLGFVDATVSDYRVHDASLTARMKADTAMQRDLLLIAAENARLSSGIRRWYLQAYSRRWTALPRLGRLGNRLVLMVTQGIYRILRSTISWTSRRGSQTNG